MADSSVPALVAGVLGGDVRALARAISLVEDGRPEARAVLAGVFARGGRSLIVGVTGPPGAGKSTLVDRVTARLRAQGKTVGVIAVDPTSPFTGGAILGDRIRMQQHALDPGVFIRSLATRGQLGGLSRSTFDVALVLDAMGFDRILIESVGVGQDEIDVMKAAHTTVVITVPGLGDDIQAIKAGILEVADVLVVNKADREGADRAMRDLIHMLDLRDAEGGRREIEIVKTIASWGLRDGSGIADLVAAIDRHRAQPDSRAIARAAAHLSELIRGLLQDRAAKALAAVGGMEEIAARIAARRQDPYSAAEEIAQGI